MRITRVNAEPYSDELHDEILREKGGALVKFLEPHVGLRDIGLCDIGPTSDRATILFERTDGENSIGVPFQSSVTSVYNRTDYTGEPRWNWLKEFFWGNLVSVDVEKLQEYLCRLTQLPVSKLRLKQNRRARQGINWENPEYEELDLRFSEKLEPKGTTEEQVNYILERFQAYPGRFRIDPESDVRVEKRAGNGIERYTTSLNIVVKTGISGAPEIFDHIGQTITAKVEYH